MPAQFLRRIQRYPAPSVHEPSIVVRGARARAGGTAAAGRRAPAGRLARSPDQWQGWQGWVAGFSAFRSRLVWRSACIRGTARGPTTHRPPGGTRLLRS